MYADYTYYKDTYKGEAGEAVYSRFSTLANAHINRITNNRAKTATGDDLEAVKMPECAIIDELDKQASGGVIASESNDGISRTYLTGSVVKSNTQRIYSAAEVYLSSTNLLFAGV